jgi:hypothetical protein
LRAERCETLNQESNQKMTTQRRQATQALIRKPINPAFCSFKFLLLTLIGLAMVKLAPACVFRRISDSDPILVGQ